MKNKKIALVTGGSRRIGASICKELHSSGIDIMIHYRDSKEEANLLKGELNKKEKILLILFKEIFVK